MKETVWGWEVLNDVKAVWLRSPQEVTKEEYIKFYKSFSKVSTLLPSVMVKIKPQKNDPKNTQNKNPKKYPK